MNQLGFRRLIDAGRASASSSRLSSGEADVLGLLAGSVHARAELRDVCITQTQILTELLGHRVGPKLDAAGSPLLRADGGTVLAVDSAWGEGQATLARALRGLVTKGWLSVEPRWIEVGRSINS